MKKQKRFSRLRGRLKRMRKKTGFRKRIKRYRVRRFRTARRSRPARRSRRYKRSTKIMGISVSTLGILAAIAAYFFTPLGAKVKAMFKKK
jgi:hypothetical protein